MCLLLGCSKFKAVSTALLPLIRSPVYQPTPHSTLDQRTQCAGTTEADRRSERPPCEASGRHYSVTGPCCLCHGTGDPFFGHLVGSCVGPCDVSGHGANDPVVWYRHGRVVTGVLLPCMVVTGRKSGRTLGLVCWRGKGNDVHCIRWLNCALRCGTCSFLFMFKADLV